MPSFPVIKALGLNTSPNQLAVPEGSLIQASNVIIKRDNVIEPRRGFKLFGQPFGTSTDTLKQTFVYRERLLRHYNDVLEFQNGINNDGSVHFDEFDGSFEETETGLRIKSIESNGNFYFTTSEGIKKISAKTGSGLSTVSGYITQSGGIKALDITGELDIELGNQTGFLPQDSAVAYRHVWGYFDANNNLILGTPSARTEVFNPLQTLLIKDFDNLLLALDNIDQTGSLITDGNYVNTLKLPISASASDVRTGLIALGAKLDADIVIAPVALTTVSAAVPSTTTINLVLSNTATSYLRAGDIISLSGFTNANLLQLNGRNFQITSFTTTTFANDTILATLVGTPVLTVVVSSADVGGVVIRNSYGSITPVPAIPSIPATNDELVDIQDYLSTFITFLQTEPIGIISTVLSDEFIIPLAITTSVNVRLTVTIPEEITSQYFIQVYRSAITQATGVIVLSDLTPDDEMQLVYEAFPTPSELAARSMEILDITPDAFRGPFLYTNEATGEGLTQANDLPPFAKDINRFKNTIFYANTRTRHRKLLSLLGVVNMLTDYGSGLNTQTFTSAAVLVDNFIGITAHGFNNGQSIRFTNPIPSNLPTGLNQGITYYILNATANSFQLTTNRNSSTPVTLTPASGSGTNTILNILPSITITNSTSSQTYYFIKGIQEVTPITAIGDTGTLDGKYFYVNSANDYNEYVVYYQENGASDSNPLIPNKIAVPVYFNAGATATTIAGLTRDALNALYPEDFSVIASAGLFTITNVDFGYTTDVSLETAGTYGFTLGTIIQGKGENASTNEVLLSDNVSPAIAVDETARSLVRVINKNASEIVYAFDLSNSDTVPGRIFLEARTLDNDPFYLIPSSETVGESFSPDLSPTLKIVSISVANPTVITTSTAHGFSTGDTIVIGTSNSTPTINGVRTVTFLTSTTFSVTVNVTIAGTYGTIISTSQAEASENELKPNRIYYSKTNQPEAVPLTNYFDVGTEEKQILRIFPLRDSLFVFKEDGLFRVSGESAPWVQALFDGTCKLIASDSLGSEGNLIYAWGDNGIVTISESGVSEPISRPIDNIILKIPTYPNFRTSTFGIGYQPDNSYLVWTINNINDEIATICYRFSSLTGTWTTFDKTNTCGIANDVDNKLYLGAGDTNFTEQERKDFTRYDYADREIDLDLTADNYFGAELKFSSVIDLEVGDVITQEQTLTVYTYNSLLKKLDIDPNVNDTNYFSTLESFGGDNLRDKIIELAQKLDADLGVSYTDYESLIESKSGVITLNTAANPTVITDTSHELFNSRIIRIVGSNSTPSIDGDFPITLLTANTFSIDMNVTVAGTSGTWTTVDDDFDDIQTCYNNIIQKLNADPGVSFSNYQEITDITIQEAIIIDVNIFTKRIIVNLNLDFVIGPIICYENYAQEIIYTPLTAGDPLGFKQFYEATIMFDNKAFTSATLGFASDLLPAFNEVPFNGDGNGIFGHFDFGTGFFGGASHSAPFRTYVPLNAQRCRYLTIKFKHNIARESFAINGLTGTYNTYSVRAYK